MERYGPQRTEYKRFKYDSKNDFYHAHVWEAGTTYVVMWEADHDKKIINVVKMGKHENFDFKRNKKHKKDKVIQRINQSKSGDKKYEEYLRFDKKRGH